MVAHGDAFSEKYDKDKPVEKSGVKTENFIFIFYVIAYKFYIYTGVACI